MTRKQKRNLIRIVTASVLFAVCMAVPENGVLCIVLCLLAYGACGWDVVWGAARHLVSGNLFDEKFLMTVATAGAMALGQWREAVAVMLFYQVGEWFQSIAVGKSRRSIAKLMDIRPDTACVLRGENEVVLPPEEVGQGETIVVRPGERIPLDGVIISGTAAVDTSALTGESMPRDFSPGDNVLSGMLNLTGRIEIRTCGTYQESAVARILELAENAAENKAKTESFITRFAAVYTPVVVAAAALLALVPPLFFGNWAAWIHRGLVFLVVSCPCALVVSVPLSFFGGIGGASRVGILFKGSECIERLEKIKTAVFDKTGTLTEGTFSVSAVHPEQGGEDELLDLAALAETGSDHPIARSIVKAHGGHIDPSRIEFVQECAGLGIEAVIDGCRVTAGNGRLMDAHGVEWHPCECPGTVVHITKDDVYRGHVVISDTVREDAAETIIELRKLGIQRTVMLTGDSCDVAEAVASGLGIDEVHAQMLPEDKVTCVERLKADGPVLFAGDGLNDAPVLALADVGIAMGGRGTDAAVEAADVVIMDDRPSRIVQAVGIAHRTMRIVRENVSFALAVKAVVLLLGAFGIAGMWMAVFADVGVMVLAILNALRTLIPGRT